MTHADDFAALVRRMVPTPEHGPRIYKLIQSGLDGGETTIEQIAALDDAPDAVVLRISGLTQRPLEYLVGRYADRFVEIEFFKCTRLSDLSPLEGLRSPTTIKLYDNRRATALWDLSRTPSIQSLEFADFRKLTDLASISSGHQLRSLSFGNRLWNTAVFQSLEPLAALSDLESLSFNAKAVLDDRAAPLGALQALRSIEFPVGLFTKQQVAWLRAKLPMCAAEEALQATRSWAAMPTRSGRVNDTRIAGRGERSYDAKMDAARIAQKVAEFELMVQHFKTHATATADAA